MAFNCRIMHAFIKICDAANVGGADPVNITRLIIPDPGNRNDLNSSAKMMLFRVTGGKLAIGRIFSLEQLLLVAACVSLISGQQGTRYDFSCHSQ